MKDAQEAAEKYGDAWMAAGQSICKETNDLLVNIGCKDTVCIDKYTSADYFDLEMALNFCQCPLDQIVQVNAAIQAPMQLVEEPVQSSWSMVNMTMFAAVICAGLYISSKRNPELLQNFKTNMIRN